MLIDANMPLPFWPWAVEHACFITKRLYNLRTKKIPVIDFLQALSQPYSEKLDLSNISRFACRAYKLIQPKPGKFEPRAEKGCFVGFQKNTNKNFLIYHPHKTPKGSLKCLISITPHVAFDENVVFGEGEAYNTDQKCACNPITSISFDESTILPPPLFSPSDVEQTRESEGEHQSFSFRDYGPENPQQSSVEDNIMDTSIDASQVELPVITEHESSGPLETQADLDCQNNYENPRKFDEIEEQPDSHLIKYHAESSQSPTSSELIEVLPDYRELLKEPSQQAQIQTLTTYTENEDAIDRIMTGWDPTPPLAGQKRDHSPESQTPYSKRGRPIRRIDYHKLHHGKTAVPYTNPKTWSEAMSRPDAAQWKQAALEEIRSLKKTGTIQLINRSQLPKGRTLMKCKWVFKKKITCKWST